MIPILGSFLKDCGLCTSFIKGLWELIARFLQDAWKGKSVGNLPIDVQTEGASTKTKESMMNYRMGDDLKFDIG
ncbi:hypothetical protein [Metabacillus malikii]|uniref:Uncharacterized protein n=1 Tax=Metabacillus malikii TaxID=1504265 RepID=A0ABT9ZAX5_9BACI|nr:hypothetical protein [Metabacillus malikii]MDQ0229407.1 hypothetical protein [Metabacillus malikii]